MITGPSQTPSQVPVSQGPGDAAVGTTGGSVVGSQQEDSFQTVVPGDVEGLTLHPVSEQSAKDLASLLGYRLHTPATFEPANGQDFSALKGVTVRADGESVLVSAPIGSDPAAVRSALEELIQSTPLAGYAAVDRQYLEADRQLRAAIDRLTNALSTPTSGRQHELALDQAIEELLGLLPYASDGVEQARALVGWMVEGGVPAEQVDRLIAGVSAFPELADAMTDERARHQPLEPNHYQPPPAEVTSTPTDFSAFLPVAPEQLSPEVADKDLRSAISELKRELSLPSSERQHELAAERALPKIVAALPYASNGGETMRELARWLGQNTIEPSLVAKVVEGLAASPELQQVMAEDIALSIPANAVSQWDPTSAIENLQPNEEWNLGWGIMGGAVLVGSFNQDISVKRLQVVEGQEQETVEASTVAGQMVHGTQEFAGASDRYVVTVGRGLAGGLMAGLGIRLGPVANLAVVGTATAGVKNSVELTFDNPEDAAKAVRIIQTLGLDDPRNAVDADAPFNAADKKLLLDNLSALEFVPATVDASLLAIAGIGPAVIGGASLGGGLSSTFRIELPEDETKGPRVIVKDTYQVFADLAQFGGANAGKVSMWAGGLGDMNAHIDAVQTRTFELPTDCDAQALLARVLEGDWKPIVEEAVKGEPIDGANKMNAVLSYVTTTDIAGGSEGQTMAVELTGEPGDMLGALWDLAHFQAPSGSKGEVQAQIYVNPTKVTGVNQPSIGAYFGALLTGHVVAATSSTGNAVFGFQGSVADAVPKVWEFLHGEYNVEATRQQLLDGSLTVDQLAGRVGLKLVSLTDLQSLVRGTLVDPVAFGDAFRRLIVTGRVEYGLVEDLAAMGLLPDDATNRIKYLARPPKTGSEGEGSAPPVPEPPPFDASFQEQLEAFPSVDVETLKAEIAAGSSSLSFAYGNVVDPNAKPRADVGTISPTMLDAALEGRDLRIFGSPNDPGRGILDAKTGEVLFWVKNVEQSKALMATDYDALASTPSDDALWNAFEPVAPVLDLATAESALEFGRLELVKPDGESASPEDLHELKGNDLRLVSGIGSDGQPLPVPVDGRPQPGNILIDLTSGTAVAVFQPGPTP